VRNWALLVSEDNREAKAALEALKRRRKGKKFICIKTGQQPDTWIEYEVKK